MNSNDSDHSPLQINSKAQIKISWLEFDLAVQKGVLTLSQAHQLWSEWSQSCTSLSLGNQEAINFETLSNSKTEKAQFSMSHILYYFGGLLSIGAMSLFMTMAWDIFGPWGTAVLTSLYLYGVLKVAFHLKKQKLFIPAGIMGALAIVLVPLIVWSIQSALGLWPEDVSGHFKHYYQEINGKYLTLELSTLAAAVLMLWYLRLPFMVMPIAVTLWYLSMDITHFLTKQEVWGELNINISMLFGLSTCALALWTDLRCRQATDPENRQDFAYWLYLFGVMMFWTILGVKMIGSEWGKIGFTLINLLMMFGGVAIQRRVFTVFGSIGVVSYLGYLSSKIFTNAIIFTFVLTLLGFLSIAAGIWWQKNEKHINQQIAKWLPKALQSLTKDLPY